MLNYEILREKVINKIPEYWKNSGIVKEILSDDYYPAFRSFDPYKEPLKTTVLFVDKNSEKWTVCGIKSSFWDCYYNVEKGVIFTGRLFWAAQHYEEYDMWADIMIAAFLSECETIFLLHNLGLENLKTYALKNLKKNNYETWRQNTKYFIPHIGDEYDVLYKKVREDDYSFSENEDNLSETIINIFKSVFEKSKIVYCGYSEVAYNKYEEEYKKVSYAFQEQLLKDIYEI